MLHWFARGQVKVEMRPNDAQRTPRATNLEDWDGESALLEQSVGGRLTNPEYLSGLVETHGDRLTACVLFEPTDLP